MSLLPSPLLFFLFLLLLLHHTQTPPDISPDESTPPTPYTFSSDPYLYTPTAAHFADPASRTVFASAVERSAWLSLRRDVKKGWLSPTWRVNDEECVKMQKGWEKMRDKRKRREDKRVVILKVSFSSRCDAFLVALGEASTLVPRNGFGVGTARR